jgi:hypothetical protein
VCAAAENCKQSGTTVRKVGGGVKVNCFQCDTCGDTFHFGCGGSDDGAYTKYSATRCSECIKSDDAVLHPESCAQCDKVFDVFDDVLRLLDNVVETRAEDEDVRTRWVRAQVGELLDLVQQYHAHMVRHFVQTNEKLRVIASLAGAGDVGRVGSIDVYIIANWAAKRSGHKLKKKQADGFGQRGRIAMHPTVFIRRANDDDDLPAKHDEERDEMLIVHRVIVLTDESEFNCVDTAGVIEISLRVYSSVGNNKRLRRAVLKTDKEATHTGRPAKTDQQQQKKKK